MEIKNKLSLNKYRNVLSGYIHDGTLLHSKSQYITVKHSRQLLEHTYTSDPHGLGNTNSYRILPTGPLVAIFHHSLPFFQSESFQTHVGKIHRRAIGPLAHHNGTSAYSPSLTCHLPAPTIGCLHSNDSLTTLFYVSRSPVSIEICLLLRS
jgi:hypothetical protein